MMETRRIYVRKISPNPLFVQWLENWMKEAESKGKLKQAKVYENAIYSLRKFPLTLYSGSDAVILEGFGPAICQRINEKLEEYLKELPDLQGLSFKDKIEVIRKKDQKEMEAFLNNLETEFDPRTYESSQNCADESDDEKETSFSTGNLSLRVVQNNVTIQDIIMDMSSSDFERVQEIESQKFPLSLNDSVDELEMQVLQELEAESTENRNNFQPPNKISRKCTSPVNGISQKSSEDEFDFLVNKFDNKPPKEACEDPSNFELREEIETKLQMSCENNNSNLRKSKTFAGLPHIRKPLDFSTPLPTSKQIKNHEINHIIDLSKSPEKDLDNNDSLAQLLPTTPLLIKNSSSMFKRSVTFAGVHQKENKIPSRSIGNKSIESIEGRKSPDFVVDLSRSPEPEEIEKELSRNETFINGRKSLNLEEMSPVTNILNRNSCAYNSTNQEFEDTIDKIIAGYGFSPISKVTHESDNKKFNKVPVSTAKADSSKRMKRSRTFAEGTLNHENSADLSPVADIINPKIKFRSPLPKLKDDDIEIIIAKYGTPKPTQTKNNEDSLKQNEPTATEENLPLTKKKSQSKLIQTRLCATKSMTQAITLKTKSTPLVRSKSSSTVTTSTLQIDKTKSLSRIGTGSQIAEEDDDLKYVSVDDINTEDFDVLLLVDTQETAGKQKSSYDSTQNGLKDNNVIFERKAPLKFQLLEFQKFNKSVSKQRKCNVRETFIKQLLALKGLSVNIAIEIASVFPTPRDLYLKFLELSKEEGEKYLSTIPLTGLKKSIPTNISKAIYHLYISEKPT